MNKNLGFYQDNVSLLVKQYDSVSFETVHSDWLNFLPAHGSALDIGAGSGRDARYLSENGLKVYAVEPVLSLMLIAQQNSSNKNINWYQDSLPNLDQIKRLNKQFDLILLSAVWMHLSPDERTESMQQMSSLLTRGGRLVITLRHGAFNDARIAFPVSANEVYTLAEKCDLTVILVTDVTSDQLGRTDVAWQTLVLENRE